MSIALPDLPYALDALEPHVSSKTLEKHYGAHHRGYVTKLNGLIEGTDYAAMELEAMVLAARSNGDTAVFNNAAQIWNHTFLWHSMAPNGGGAPGAELVSTLENSFSSLGGARPVRQRLGLARAEGWQARDRVIVECRRPACERFCTAIDARRLGTRVLPRLPERAQSLRRCVPRASA